MKQLDEDKVLEKLEIAREKGLLRRKDQKDKKGVKGAKTELKKKKAGDEGSIKKKPKFTWVEGLHKKNPKKEHPQKDGKDGEAKTKVSADNQKVSSQDKGDKKKDKGRKEAPVVSSARLSPTSATRASRSTRVTREASPSSRNRRLTEPCPTLTPTVCK